MTFTNPLAWGLLLLAIPIILFFLLKVRFRKELVATTIFWQQVFEERRIRTLYRRFRYFVSLFLALLFLSFLTAAVLDPVFFITQNNRCVIIIDNSASMNVLLPSSETTRLDFAKQQAKKQLNRITAGQQVAILTANINPKIMSGFTDHTGTLRRKLTEISATDFPTGLMTALQLAEQLITDQPDSPIYIYTGTNVPEDILPLKSNIHVFQVGLPTDNVAITRFQPRRLPAHAVDYEILAEIINFGTEVVQTRLEIDCEGKIVDILPLSLEPNKPVIKIIRGTSEGGLFRAKLATADSFPTDDVAIAFLSKQFVQHILLHGQDNFFLWHVLQALPQTEVNVIENIPDSIPPDNVLVLHQTIPPTLPQGNIIMIDPQNNCNLFRVEERLAKPIAVHIDPKNSLVRFIPPGLIFANAKNIIPSKNNFKVLAATADNFPLYLQFVSENQRTLLLTADLNQGDFSLRTTFPILISQALTYFRNSEELQKAYSTAEPITLTLQTENPQIILRSPSGQEEIFPCQNGSVSLGKLGECGIWTILDPESKRELTQIACSLFNATESNLRSATELPVQSETKIDTLFIRPIWYYLALLTLFFTVMEWFLYQRRWIE